METGKPVKIPLEELFEIYKKALGEEGLGCEVYEEIALMANTRYFNKDAFIFHEGDRPDYFYVVVTGRVNLTKGSPEGRRFTAIVAEPGEALNAVVLFSHRPRFLSAQALENVVLACVDAEDFIAFAFRHPAVMRNIINFLGEITESSYDRLIDIMGETVEQRLLNVLYMLYSKFGTILKFTNHDLASLAGTTPETANRIIGKLRHQGIIDTSYGEVHIHNHKELENLSRGPFAI